MLRNLGALVFHPLEFVSRAAQEFWGDSPWMLFKMRIVALAFVNIPVTCVVFNEFQTQHQFNLTH